MAAACPCKGRGDRWISGSRPERAGYAHNGTRKEARMAWGTVADSEVKEGEYCTLPNLDMSLHWYFALVCNY